MQATYKNQGEPAFQDGVGRLIVDSAATIPDGLLVFLPSYVLLDKLMVRWKVSGVIRGSSWGHDGWAWCTAATVAFAVG